MKLSTDITCIRLRGSGEAFGCQRTTQIGRIEMPITANVAFASSYRRWFWIWVQMLLAFNIEANDARRLALLAQRGELAMLVGAENMHKWPLRCKKLRIVKYSAIMMRQMPDQQIECHATMNIADWWWWLHSFVVTLIIRTKAYFRIEIARRMGRAVVSQGLLIANRSHDHFIISKF